MGSNVLSWMRNTLVNSVNWTYSQRLKYPTKSCYVKTPDTRTLQRGGYTRSRKWRKHALCHLSDIYVSCWDPCLDPPIAFPTRNVEIKCDSILYVLCKWPLRVVADTSSRRRLHTVEDCDMSLFSRVAKSGISWIYFTLLHARFMMFLLFSFIYLKLNAC